MRRIARDPASSCSCKPSRCSLALFSRDTRHSSLQFRIYMKCLLFGASFFFTSVPRNAIEGFVDLADDPDAPTNVFR